MHSHPVSPEAELEACDCPACQEAWQEAWQNGRDDGAEDGAEEVLAWLQRQGPPELVAAVAALAPYFWAYYHAKGGLDE